MNRFFPPCCSDALLLWGRITLTSASYSSFSGVYFLREEKSTCLTHFVLPDHIRGHWRVSSSTPPLADQEWTLLFCVTLHLPVAVWHSFLSHWVNKWTFGVKSQLHHQLWPRAIIQLNNLYLYNRYNEINIIGLFNEK